jgi:hypothetical protein
MKTIPLTQGQIALVDDEDFVRFGEMKWFAQWDKGTKSFYARNHMYLGGGRKNPIRKMLHLHREIMGVTDTKVKVDHRNHCTLDCQRHNLRIATDSQNQANRNGAQSRNTSGFRGVSWKKELGKWSATIGIYGKKVHLGYFTDITEARTSYSAANRQHFGEFGGNL